MNPGQDFSSLSVSASGGELSRLMLALKVVFQASNGIENHYFLMKLIQVSVVK